MKGPELLAHYEDNWETDMGAWFPGERVVFRGKDLLNELSDLSWLQLLYLGINGKEYYSEKLEFVNAAYVLCTSYPDPRLWNNRVASLGGTVRSTACLATSVATAVSEATVYGRRPDIQACDFLIRARSKIEAGATIPEVVEAEIKKYRGLPGYGRPVTRADERIVPILRKAKDLGLDGGEYLQLAFSIQNYLKGSKRKLSLNIAGIVSAIMADIGTTPKEYYLFCLFAFSAGMLPCFLDAESKSEGAFFPLSTKRINYLGHENRKW